jgi:toxin ParE1/3/4
MAEYFLTNKAVEDLSSIWNYTYKVWSEKQADKYYKQIIDCCRDIAENPELGRYYDEINSNILGYKTKQHIVFYRINQQDIEILRILHVRMDLKSRMQE